MKRKTILSILGFVAAGAVAVYGVISLLKDTNIIRPDKFAIESASLHVQVNAVADWSATNNTFTTETSSEGFMDDDWDMPGLQLSESLDKATLTITIENLSNTAAELEISGIGYDREVWDIGNHRFRTVVEQWAPEATVATNITNINESSAGTTTFRLNSIAPGETIILKVVYELVATNLAFTVENNITMSFNIVTPGE